MNVLDDIPLVRKSKSPIFSAVQHQEGQRSWLGPLFCWLYGFSRQGIRSIILWIVEKLEGGQLYTLTSREILRKYHGVEVGLYTMGSPLVPKYFPSGTKIGRYSSIFWTVRAFNANRPRNLKSTHGLFYNPGAGLVDQDLITRPPIVIGNDVFIGHNAIILASVRKIGDGAIIGAGSVLYEDVPPYAIVMGHPARVVSYRFKKETVAELLASRWWDKPLSELAQDIESFRRTLDGGPVR